MTSFEADLEKFPHGLAGFRKDLTELGLEQLLVWHTFSGYWSGMSPKVYGEYGVKERNYLIPPRHLAAGNGDRPESGPDEGLDTTGVGKRFYPMNLTKKQTGLSYMQFGRLMHDFHYYLARQGVDGVKIDAMTWIEGYATGQGGMDALAGTMMQALETSAIDCLNGNLLCCSSCSNSILFHSGAGTTVTRTSTDFFPNRPETHGEHILTNVHTSFWMGQVIYPDWDMFQSGHPAGLFHAAARAISGGPVYTTDEPGKEDPEVIRKVRLGDGRVALCTHHARICEDSLFVDPFLNRDLVKIFNFNPCGQVIGIFNCSWPGAGENAEGNGAAAGLVAGATGSAAEAAASPDMHISGRIRLKDVHGLPDGQYAVHINGETGITLMDADSGMDITLPPLGFRICTLAPVTDGFAPIGLIKMFNPGGTVAEVYRNRTGASVFVKLLDGGEFLAYSTSRPRQVLLSGMELAWDYDPETGSLRVQVPGQGDHLLEIFQPV
ncbi:MAG TPA: hypothetical protein DD727_03190 [Clostridiales bacterium]|nr:hypothetical protein [Clostridiales bacterium]